MGQILDRLRRFERIGLRPPSSLPALLDELPTLVPSDPPCQRSPEPDAAPEREASPRAPAYALLEPARETLPALPRFELTQPTNLLPERVPVREPAPTPAPVDPERTARARRALEQANRLCDVVDAASRLIVALTAPLVEVEGFEGVARRLAGVMGWISERHPILAKLVVGPGGVLEPELLVCRALRRGADGKVLLRDALREIVDYLEFELINHPEIDRSHELLHETFAHLRKEAAHQLAS